MLTAIACLVIKWNAGSGYLKSLKKYPIRRGNVLCSEVIIVVKQVIEYR